jgi:5-methylcytosine-specific restriction endonuclease McrBC regulatory subunit McrC
MGKLNKLEWKNIYYMLCYCVDELKYFEISDIEYEKLNGTNDLLAALLTKSFELLVRNGYIREYNKTNIITDRPRGNINIPKSIQTGNYGRGKLNCCVTNFDTNNNINQIIKAAFKVLIINNNVTEDKISKNLLIQLNKCIELLRKVDNISVNKDTVNSIQDIPEWYKPVMVVCKLIINDWITLDETGKHRILELNDKNRLCYIWQKYILSLCKKHFKEYRVHNDVLAGNGRHFWKPDMVIENEHRKYALIADAKWYEVTEKSINNINQVNTYEDKFKDEKSDYKTDGIILYASNNETILHPTEDMGNGNSVTEIEINIRQSKDKMEFDIIRIVDEYI